jgi:hypothetical protein
MATGGATFLTEENTSERMLKKQRHQYANEYALASLLHKQQALDVASTQPDLLPD